MQEDYNSSHTGQQIDNAIDRVIEAEGNGGIKTATPKLTEEQKNALLSLHREYWRDYNDNTFEYENITQQTHLGTAATRNSYANKDTAISQQDVGKYKIQCALYCQLLWMGRSPSDFKANTEDYLPNITKVFNWGYYFNFALRKSVYGIVRQQPTTSPYFGFVKPNLDSYVGSYSYNTSYTGATDDPYGMGQTFTNFMGASEMARELYEIGCEIPYNELDIGDLVFCRATNFNDGYNDLSEWSSFRHINHVVMVYGFYTDAKGNKYPKFAESIEADGTKPIRLASLEPAATGLEKTRCARIMRSCVMCARHPAAFGKGGNVPDEIEVI